MLFKLFITFLCLFLLLRWLAKPLLRIMVQRMVNKMMKQQQQAFNAQQKQYQNTARKDGKVYVDYVPQNDKKDRGKDSDMGEYVDYEEVK